MDLDKFRAQNTTIELLVDAVKKTGNDSPDKVAETLHNTLEFQGNYERIRLNDKGDAVIPLIVTQYKLE